MGTLITKSELCLQVTTHGYYYHCFLSLLMLLVPSIILACFPLEYVLTEHTCCKGFPLSLVFRSLFMYRKKFDQFNIETASDVLLLFQAFSSAPLIVFTVFSILAYIPPRSTLVLSSVFCLLACLLACTRLNLSYESTNSKPLVNFV